MSINAVKEMIETCTPVPPPTRATPNFAQKATHYLTQRLDAVWTMIIRLSSQGLRIQIGKHTIIRRGAVLSTSFGGSISLGEFCEIHPSSMILTYGGDIRIGNYCSLNPASIIYGHGGVTIGNDVRIAAHCVIIPANHQIAGPSDSIYRKPVVTKGITIDNNVWIGTHCVILDGVRIAEGCVIAAGSVVTRSTESNGIYAGVPARRVKSREVLDAQSTAFKNA